VDYHLEDVLLKGAWTGPSALALTPHALAPVAELPVLEVISAVHILADLTLGLGNVVYDYLSHPDFERAAAGPAAMGRLSLPQKGIGCSAILIGIGASIGRESD
jgi:acetoacetate decarboxylase